MLTTADLKKRVDQVRTALAGLGRYL